MNLILMLKNCKAKTCCEHLLLPASSVVERARLVKQVTREPPAAKKSKLLLRNNQQNITSS